MKSFCPATASLMLSKSHNASFKTFLNYIIIGWILIKHLSCLSCCSPPQTSQELAEVRRDSFIHTFLCPVCDAIFERQDQHDSHIEDCHPEISDSFEGTFANVALILFTKLSVFVFGNITGHSHACPMCDEFFADDESLQIHVNVHFSDDSRSTSQTASNWATIYWCF